MSMESPNGGAEMPKKSYQERLADFHKELRAQGLEPSPPTEAAVEQHNAMMDPELHKRIEKGLRRQGPSREVDR